MKTEINVEDYLSQDEIKQIVIDQVKSEVRELFKTEENAKRILSNLSYELVFNEIDKVIPNSRQLIIEKTTSILNNIQSYSVFRNRDYGKASLAYELMEQAVRENKDLLNHKVKETITDKDYSQEIWSKFEELGETFMSNIYAISELGRSKVNVTPPIK